MIAKFKKAGLLLGLLVSAIAVQAGSPDGLSVAAIAADATASQYTGLVERFLKNATTYQMTCSGENLLLGNMYTTGLPRQLTSELALGAVRDKSKRKKLGKILRDFHDEVLSHGFDAVLVYEVKDGQLYFHGISADAGIKQLTSSLAVSVAKDQKKFDNAACLALAVFPVLAEP